MQFCFLVGVHEQRQVDFSFDQVIGNLEIKVDGQPLVKNFLMLSLRLTKRYEFTVGIQEQHHVKIEKNANSSWRDSDPSDTASSSIANWSRPMKALD